MSSSLAHGEDPIIEDFARQAERTDELAIRRSLFGWRELLSVVIPLAGLVLVVQRIDWSLTGTILSTVNGTWVVAALVVYLISFPLRAWRWAVLLRTKDVAVPFNRLVGIVLVGWFVSSLAPAKLGDLYRCFLAKRRFDVPLSRAIVTVVSERILDLVVMLALLMATSYLVFGRVEFALLALILIVVPALLAAVASRAEGLVPQAVQRIGRLFREVILIPNLAALGAVTLAIWVAEALRLAFVLLALGIDLPFPAVMVVAITSAILTAVPLTPAGFGAVEIGVTLLLTSAMHVSAPAAVQVVVLDRLISVGSILIIGGAIYVRNARAREQDAAGFDEYEAILNSTKGSSPRETRQRSGQWALLIASAATLSLMTYMILRVNPRSSLDLAPIIASSGATTALLFVARSFWGRRPITTVFIAHTVAHFDQARALAKRLELDGHRVRLAEDEIAVGEWVRRRTSRLIHDSDAVVALVSRDASHSLEFIHEIEEARSLGRAVLPVMVDPELSWSPRFGVPADLMGVSWTVDGDEWYELLRRSLLGASRHRA